MSARKQYVAEALAQSAGAASIDMIALRPRMALRLFGGKTLIWFPSYKLLSDQTIHDDRCGLCYTAR